MHNMRNYSKYIVVASALAALAAPSAAMAAGNSDAAHACQQGGWQNLVRQDGTGFTNTGDCVTYAANGGTLSVRSTNIDVSGSENFAENMVGSQPTQFSWGTVDPSSYAPGAAIPDGGWGGSILASGPYFNGFSPAGSHFLFTGVGQDTAKLTFNNAVQSVSLLAENDRTGISPNLTLTGYDANDVAVAHDTEVDVATGVESVPLSIKSSSHNIKYITVSTDESVPTNNAGLGLTNIVWS
jgi:hypothetical protein